MVLGGTPGDHQARGDLAVRQARRHEPQHLDLALSEVRRTGAPTAGAHSRGGQHRRHRVRVEPSGAGVAAQSPCRVGRSHRGPVRPVLDKVLVAVGRGEGEPELRPHVSPLSGKVETT